VDERIALVSTDEDAPHCLDDVSPQYGRPSKAIPYGSVTVTALDNKLKTSERLRRKLRRSPLLDWGLVPEEQDSPEKDGPRDDRATVQDVVEGKHKLGRILKRP
jgi:hypothetical protein